MTTTASSPAPRSCPAPGPTATSPFLTAATTCSSRPPTANGGAPSSAIARTPLSASIRASSACASPRTASSSPQNSQQLNPGQFPAPPVEHGRPGSPTRNSKSVAGPHRHLACLLLQPVPGALAAVNVHRRHIVIVRIQPRLVCRIIDVDDLQLERHALAHALNN